VSLGTGTSLKDTGSSRIHWTFDRSSHSGEIAIDGAPGSPTSPIAKSLLDEKGQVQLLPHCCRCQQRCFDHLIGQLLPGRKGAKNIAMAVPHSAQCALPIRYRVFRLLMEMCHLSSEYSNENKPFLYLAHILTTEYGFEPTYYHISAF
jgi:hypothetical protein